MGGGKGGKTKIESPNPYDVALAEFAANNFTQNTPLGSLQFTPPELLRDKKGRGIGFEGQAQADLILDPRVQQLLDSQLRLDQNTLNQSNIAQGALNEFLGTPMAGREGLGDLGQFRDDATNAYFDTASGLLDRAFGTREAELRQRLTNQGIPGTSEAAIGSGTGGEAFGAFSAFEDERNRAYRDLANQSVLAGQQEAQLMAGLNQTDVNLQNASRAGQFNELAALLGLQQVAQPGLQNFFGPGGANVTGAFGLQNQANIANAQNAQASRSGLLSGLFQLGSGALTGAGAAGGFGQLFG